MIQPVECAALSLHSVAEALFVSVPFHLVYLSCGSDVKNVSACQRPPKLAKSCSGSLVMPCCPFIFANLAVSAQTSSPHCQYAGCNGCWLMRVPSLIIGLETPYVVIHFFCVAFFFLEFCLSIFKCAFKE